MTDYTELKRLAEAANAVTGDASVDITISSEPGPNQAEIDAVTAFVGAATPAAVLALIAENERLAVACERAEQVINAESKAAAIASGRANLLQAERDQLKAENERLSTENSEIESAAITYIEDMQEAQRENARLTELFTVGMTLDGNLRVYGDWQSVRKAQEILAERDQLRAEIAGLKTGYEAYELVNAELKAESEALRRLAPSKEIIWCACGDGYPVNSHGAGFMDANDGVCANCDAAMGKGELS